jgi:hypothetical protein
MEYARDVQGKYTLGIGRCKAASLLSSMLDTGLGTGLDTGPQAPTLEIKSERFSFHKTIKAVLTD